METLVILNPWAGRGRGARQRGATLRGMRDAGLAFDLAETTAPGHAETLARDALAAGVTRIVVAGGDGTVHEVARALLAAHPAADGATPAALGVIPLGTGDDFAKLVGMFALPPEAAAARLAHAGTEIFDVGRAWGEPFVNLFGVGFDAEVVRHANRIRRLRGVPVYLAAIYRTFATFRPPVLAIGSAEHREEGAMMMVSVNVGICGGGGFYLTPQADPMDGLLDVCLIRKVGLMTFLRAVPRVMKGTHGTLDEVEMFRTRSVTIRSAGVPLVAQLDGELRESGLTEVEVTVEPRRLRVLVGR
jgi:YegS/Rv2252/BmrU family lipid kinase